MADTIVNLLIPEVWNEYFLELTTTKSNLIESGIVVPDSTMNTLAMKGGNTIDLPFFNDLTGDDTIIIPGTPSVPTSIGASQDMARLNLRMDSRKVHDLEPALSGADPMAVVANRIHAFWMRKEQALLLAILKGVFLNNAQDDTSDLIHNHASEILANVKDWNDAAPTVMCPEAILDGQALLGDAQDRFVAIAMHSHCYTHLLKQELIDFIQPSGVSSKIPTYLDKRVIVDDSLPTRAGTTSGTVYQSFLFGEGAVARGEGRAPVPSEFAREALSSETYFITRRHFILHPRGFKFTNHACAAAAPTNAECQDVDNWDRVYSKKNVRIAMIETN